jgi:heat shock protein HslJ
MKRACVRAIATSALIFSLFACAPEPAGLDGDWLVQQIAGAPLGSEEQIYLSIDTQSGSLQGFTGCNVLSADISTYHMTVTVTNIIEANAPCPSESARINELRLLNVLPFVAYYARRGRSLELLGREAHTDPLLRLRADDFATPARKQDVDDHANAPPRL